MEPSREWKETIAADEDARFERLANRLAEVQKERKATARGLHAKSLGGVRARFTVLDGLPEHARQGLFVEPREFRAYVRLSNGSGANQADRAPDLRGLAIKVLEVDGEKVLGDARTQDFLLIDAPTVPFKTPDEFIDVVCATAEKKGAIGRVIGSLGFFRTIGLLFDVARSVKGKRASVVDLKFFSVTPISFGPYAVRLSAAPMHAPGTESDVGASRDYLVERARARMSKEKLEWEIRAQFFTGEETPIEDTRVTWPSPEIAIARLTIDPTGEESADGKRTGELVESLSFDPWHALVAHRPLGAAMRARKHAYFASTKTRGAVKEPDGSEWK